MVAAVLTQSMRSLLPILAVPYAPGPPASRPMPHAQPSVDREWEGVTIPAHRTRVGSRRGLLVMMGILGGLVDGGVREGKPENPLVPGIAGAVGLLILVIVGMALIGLVVRFLLTGQLP